VEKEGEPDKVAYEKYDCQCVTHDAEKTVAIEAAETRIDDLPSNIEEYAALSAKLKTEIGQLEDDIAANLNALETATAQREKEQAEFAAEEADMKDAMAAMKEAIDVLSKVQLMQKQGKGQEHEVGQMLLQVRSTLHRIPNLKQYRNVMQADLWDFLSTTNADAGFLPKLSALAQQPIEGGGAAAGAKSYNSASGQILGMLTQMHDTFGANLASSQKEELSALISFHNLRAAKLAEIDAMNKQKDAKSQQLADTTQADAQAKQDLEDTKEQMSADQSFLIQLKKDCKVADEEYAARAKMRADEVMALGEALKILTGDAARDLFGKTMSFVQISAVGSSRVRVSAQNTARTQAVQQILAVARRTKNWQLAALAVSTQLDKFTKVNEAMDKMTAELKQQQKDEYEKNDFCKKELDTNEDTTKVKTYEKEDLDDKLDDLKNTISVLTEEIENNKIEIGEMQVSLKRAGEDRKAENQDFQAQVADQRAVVSIMNKVLDRLNEFYAKKSFVQVGVHDHQAPPPKPAATAEKSGGAGGALQLIAMIIEDAEKEEMELVHDENSAQEAYAGYITETNACVAACQQSIVEKEEALGLANAGKAETEAALMAVNAELTSLQDLNVGLHKDCDFLMENFEIRQTARKAEMDSIDEAKAILSGAK